MLKGKLGGNLYRKQKDFSAATLFGQKHPETMLHSRRSRTVKRLRTVLLQDHVKHKQDGNVPSRRHILGSKIFKEQLLETFGKIIFFQKKFEIFFSKKKYIFRKSHNAEKLKKRPFRLIKRFYKPKTSKKCN